MAKYASQTRCEERMRAQHMEQDSTEQVAGTSNSIVELLGRIFGVREKELENVRGTSNTSSIPAWGSVVITSPVLITEAHLPMEARVAVAHAMRESLQNMEHGERFGTDAKETGS
jgi:hypothetical protein